MPLSVRRRCSVAPFQRSAYSANFLAALVFLQLYAQLFAHSRGQFVGLAEESSNAQNSLALQSRGTIAAATACTNVSFSEAPFSFRYW